MTKLIDVKKGKTHTMPDGTVIEPVDVTGDDVEWTCLHCCLPVHGAECNRLACGCNSADARNVYFRVVEPEPEAPVVPDRIEYHEVGRVFKVKGFGWVEVMEEIECDGCVFDATCSGHPGSKGMHCLSTLRADGLSAIYRRVPAPLAVERIRARVERLRDRYPQSHDCYGAYSVVLDFIGILPREPVKPVDADKAALEKQLADANAAEASVRAEYKAEVERLPISTRLAWIGCTVARGIQFKADPGCHVFEIHGHVGKAEADVRAEFAAMVRKLRPHNAMIAAPGLERDRVVGCELCDKLLAKLDPAVEATPQSDSLTAMRLATQARVTAECNAKFASMVREAMEDFVTAGYSPRGASMAAFNKLLVRLKSVEPPTMTHSEAILAVLQGATAEARRVAEPRAHVWYTDYANRISAEYPNGKEDIKATDWFVESEDSDAKSS